MEDPKAARSTARPSKKMRLESFQDSPYYKMRVILRDLRPHFLEVLRTPDFKNCKAADEIRNKMKLLMQLYQATTADAVNLEKCKNMPSQSSPGNIQDNQKPKQQQEDATMAEKAQSEGIPTKPAAEDKLQFEGQLLQGSYVVGGSAFGWNFITFIEANVRPGYYGRTKEAFRSANVKSE